MSDDNSDMNQKRTHQGPSDCHDATYLARQQPV